MSKNVDEKDELLLKAQKVTSYLKEEKEKLLCEFGEKEAFFKENIRQLEKVSKNIDALGQFCVRQIILVLCRNWKM